ncbi:T cell receptor beta chain MC.7.G5-like [Natator depressus]|uniref:T cell receptor beta chain MC.7.G5-like n=1 Tax=Natator depressus TaxID=27790 RepID=UPI003EB6C02E
MVPCLLFMVVLSPWGWAIRQPPGTVVSQGQPLTLNCSLSTTQITTRYWYKQAVGKDARLQLVMFSTEGSSANVEKPFEGHFQSSGIKNNVLSLSAERAQSQGHRDLYFGDGTRLTVLEDELTITSPEVAIFPPSKQEIKEKGKATLVCLATKFYPDHIKLVWQVNDAEREDGVRTDEFSTWHEKSKSYSLTSRLRISTKEWFNSKNSFRCAVKFHLDEIQYKVIRGGDGCGITEVLCEEREQVVLSQVPGWVTQKTETMAKLHCYQNNTDHGWMYWY